MAKRLTKMSRTIGAIEKIARIASTELFEKRLGKPIQDMPIFTVNNRHRNAWGYTSVARVWNVDGETKREIGITARLLTADIEEIVDTIIHELVHIYALENGIQDVSRGGYYHNKEFKRLAETVGLKCVDCGSAGWNTTPKENEFIIDFICEHNIEEFLMCSDEMSRVPQMPTQTNTSTASQTATTSGTRKNSWKHTCPKCGAIARTGKPSIVLVCGNCMERMNMEQ